MGCAMCRDLDVAAGEREKLGVPQRVAGAMRRSSLGASIIAAFSWSTVHPNASRSRMSSASSSFANINRGAQQMQGRQSRLDNPYHA